MIVNLLAVQFYVRAVLLVIGEEEGRAHVAFVSLAARVLAEDVVEAAEVRQVGHVGDEALDARIERGLLVRILGELALQAARDVGQHLDQVGDVTARVVDVSLKQNAVARSLIELDIELTCQQSLEGRAVEARRTAQERDSRGIEDEFVGGPGVDRLSSSSLPPHGSPQIHSARYSAGTICAFVAIVKYLEISGCRFTSRRRMRESSIARPTNS